MNRPWPQLIAMLFLCLVSCAVEPCDGHSCDQDGRGARIEFSSGVPLEP